MEEKENKRVSLIVDDGSSLENSAGEGSKGEKLKKPLIFGLMGIVFFACLYLIFKPKSEQQENLDAGLKNAVPEATDKGLQSDKQKAYEKEMIEEREEAKRNALMSLSDYWNSGADSNSGANSGNPLQNQSSGFSGNSNSSGYAGGSLNSYQNAQQTLSSFYRDDDREKLQLRRQVDQLKERLSDRDVPATPTIKDQLTLMEKSYEMASKYLPTGSVPQGLMNGTAKAEVPVDTVGTKKYSEIVKVKKTEGLKNAKKNVVSALYREPDDSSFLAGLHEDRNRSFITTGEINAGEIEKNSIRAIVMETKTITGEGSVKLRLSESAMIAGKSVLKGTEIVAETKFQGNRLQLKVSSVEVKGNIIPVEILVYGLDGQLGLAIPRSDEVSAAAEIAANMSQSSGMNISMSRSAGQQITGDLSRGLIQGVSGFFSKKLRATKVTLNAGLPVLLLTKK
ncbi:Bacteroides conjugative transposon TraM protein [Chryseobacterium arachidis]|uniref:Bacteroides conjugative transposon TraM protein n=1 Tax=Chryseobacterium arachidis TaxID=1416778 RepID=A0A1M5IDA3_9FLAO|nr:conjugative transposon protein TraM [Chryseobacterium arachidis]SHG26334.1 Bacteroides conjugative transposon TraM protein [Chryseobacterium arachidis]